MSDNKKILFIGGIKSGKSKLAEKRILELSKDKPIYLATSEIFDDEMKKKIEEHKKQRANNFITIEESLNIDEVVAEQNSFVLVECLTIWINNMLHYKKNEEDILNTVNTICEMNKNIVFVINETGLGVIPENSLARLFVNISGKVSQTVASYCEEVHYCVAGLSFDLKKQGL